MTTRIGAALVVAMLVGGCSGAAAVGTPQAPPPATATPAPAATPTPWPDGWDSLACDVIAQFTTTADHLGAISDAADAFDLDTLTSESKAMAAEMKTANEDITAMPAWAPAATFVKHLKAAVAALRKGANLLEVGVSEVDAATVAAAIKEIDKGTPELTAATTAAGALADKYGLAC